MEQPPSKKKRREAAEPISTEGMTDPQIQRFRLNQQELSRQRNLNDKSKGKLKDLKTQLKEKDTRISILETQVAQARTDGAVCMSSTKEAEYIAKIHGLEEQLAAALSTNQCAAFALDKARITGLEAHVQTLEALVRRQFDSEKEYKSIIQRLETQQDEYRTNIDGLKTNQDEYKSRIEDLETQLASHALTSVEQGNKSNIANLGAQLTSLKIKCTDLEAQQSQRARKETTLQLKIKELEQEVASHTSREN
ncbi:MAG: hypothetical protein SGARI_002898, partial [Bacillariaceae sp.]